MNEQKLLAALLVRRVVLLVGVCTAACALAVVTLGIAKGAALCAMVAGAAVFVGGPPRSGNGE